MATRRIPYNRDSSMDVSNELEKLRNHYADLKGENILKAEIAMQKAMNAKPSKMHLRLYKEGVNKIAYQKIEEALEKANDAYVLDVRSASPSPICDRLYKEGMQKKLVDRGRELERDQRDAPSPSPGKKIAFSPIHDRLYNEGMQKIRARNQSFSPSRSGESPHQASKGPRGRSSSSNRISRSREAALRTASKNRLPRFICKPTNVPVLKTKASNSSDDTYLFSTDDEHSEKR
eukprot:scaffold2463_cov261-Chaetoceros_neogracile.AAC.4